MRDRESLERERDRTDLDLFCGKKENKRRKCEREKEEEVERGRREAVFDSLFLSSIVPRRFLPLGRLTRLACPSLSGSSLAPFLAGLP